ncbi:hypothetical protein G6F68_019214 [Rhizopus microsporus]|nr:hypothetical protein G6F68_019214 [Rhizopus microsporus]
MASRAPRFSRAACSSRSGSTPTRAAFQRLALTMATWPSLLRAKSAPGVCRRCTSQPSRLKPASTVSAKSAHDMAAAVSATACTRVPEGARNCL